MSQESNQSAGRHGRGGQEPQQGQGGQQPQQSGGGQQASTAQGQQAQTQPQGQGAPGGQQQQRGTAEQLAGWFTEKFVRVVAVLIGLIMLLFALGQIAGVNLLSTVGDFITSSVGGYVIIAFFALLIIVAATKDWNISNT